MRDGSPQSHREELIRSPVKQLECIRTEGHAVRVEGGVTQHERHRHLLLVLDAVDDNPELAVLGG